MKFWLILKDVCLIGGFLLSWILVSQAFRVSPKEDAKKIYIKFQDSSFGYLWIVLEDWLIFFLVFGFSMLAGYFGNSLSIFIFVFFLSLFMIRSVKELLWWVFNPNPFVQLLNRFLEASILCYLYQQAERKSSFNLLRFIIQHIFMRKKIKRNLMKKILTGAAKELRKEELGVGAKKFMEYVARYKSVLGAARKATKQSKHEDIISLQKNFIIAFLVTLLIILLGFSSIAWNLHILDMYQLVEKDGLVIHDFLTYVYFTMITISTVGYGDVLPANNFARIFSIIEIFTGLFLIIIVIASFANITMKLYDIPDFIRSKQTHKK